jgi:hypothetical protein
MSERVNILEFLQDARYYCQSDIPGLWLLI